MVHTVGLQGHTGRIGSVIFEYLVKAHQDQKIVLVILHRPGSDISAVPSGVEKRELDLSKAYLQKVKDAVAGLNIYVSAVGLEGLGDQEHLFEPLSQTPGFVTYFSPLLGLPTWTADGQPDDKRVWDAIQGFRHLTDKPKQIGLGLTRMTCGVFADYFFDFRYVHSDLSKNVVSIYGNAKTMPLPIVSNDCLGKAVAEVAMRRPEDIKNKIFYTFDYHPTGDEIIRVFEKLNGTPPTIAEYTQAEYEAALDSKSMAMSPAWYKRKWSTGDWKWEGERVGQKEQDFEALARRYQK